MDEPITREQTKEAGSIEYEIKPECHYIIQEVCVGRNQKAQEKCREISVVTVEVSEIRML